MAKPPTGSFDSSRYGKAGFSPVPPGEYDVIMIESEFKKSRSGNGHHFDPILSIVGGPYKGKQIRPIINYVNENPIAQDIGEREMADLTRAIFGFDKDWPDSIELHGKPFSVKVEIQDGQGGFPDKNIVTRYLQKTNVVLAESEITHQEPPEEWSNPYDESEEVLPDEEEGVNL
jgi:hypothetical protein